MTQSLIAILAGWLTTAALLIIQHLLWSKTSRQVRYLLGGGAICAGCSAAGAVADNALLAVAPWAIASAGLIILVLYWFEGQAEARRVSAQKNGELIGAARGLAKELTEDAESRVDQARRRN